MDWVNALAPVSAVEREHVAWLWPGRVPLGKVTALDGDPGLGKSTITLDVAARVTTGRAMPDGSHGSLVPSTVLVLTAEDGIADTVRPRLEAAGADLDRVIPLHEVPGSDGRLRPVALPRDVSQVADAVDHYGARLVIVDPLVAFLDSGVNVNKDHDVRHALRPVAALAEQTRAAVVFVRHLNKSPSTNALLRGGGSIGIIGAARAGLLVARHPEDDARRVLAVTKNNLAAEAPALVYQLEQWPQDPSVATVAWEGTTNLQTHQLLSEEQNRGARAEAKQFLRDLLAEGAMPATRVRNAAEGEGIAEATLTRAKRELGVRSTKTSEGGWEWILPEADAEEAGHGERPVAC